MSELYASWPDRPLPAATRLHGLVPVGLETSMVESLSSYLRRLAASHGLTPGRLVMHVVAPALAAAGAETPVNGGFPQLRGLLVRGATAINGNTRRASHWAMGCGVLTGQAQLGRLTLLALSAIPRRALIRPTRAYCSACLREQRARGTPACDPLLWSIAAVTVCARHSSKLADRCPRAECGSVLPHLTWRGQSGHCHRCGIWLGIGAIVAGQVSEYERWAALQVERLVVETSAGRTFSGMVGNAVSSYLDTGGEIAKALARRSGIGSGALSEYLAGTSSPSLPTTLRLAYAAGLDVVELLDGRSRITYPQRTPDMKATPRIPIEWKRVRRRLKGALDVVPPRSLRQVVVGIGAERTSVRSHEPDLCAAISARYAAWQRQAVAERDAKLCNIVTRVVTELVGNGRCASRREVEAQLPSAVSLREPRLYTAWQEARSQHTRRHGCYVPEGQVPCPEDHGVTAEEATVFAKGGRAARSSEDPGRDPARLRQSAALDRRRRSGIRRSGGRRPDAF